VTVTATAHMNDMANIEPTETTASTTTNSRINTASMERMTNTASMERMTNTASMERMTNTASMERRDNTPMEVAPLMADN